MSQSLVVHEPNEDVCMHHGAADAAVQRLAAVVRIASGRQLLPEVVDDAVLLVEREGG